MAGRAGVVSGRACLGCAAALADPFLDLGAQPLANAFVRPEDAARPEPRFPLAVAYCARCHLVQLTATAPTEALFEEYLYFTSYSDHFLVHARAMAAALQFFLERGVPVLGVEPARNVAAVATGRGIPTLNLRKGGAFIVAVPATQVIDAAP